MTGKTRQHRETNDAHVMHREFNVTIAFRAKNIWRWQNTLESDSESTTDEQFKWMLGTFFGSVLVVKIGRNWQVRRWFWVENRIELLKLEPNWKFYTQHRIHDAIISREHGFFGTDSHTGNKLVSEWWHSKRHVARTWRSWWAASK